MIRAALIAVVLLSGCASYSGRLSEAPVFTGSTDKSPQAFAACVMPGMLAVTPTARVIPYGDGQQITAGDALATTTYYVLSVHADGRVEHRGDYWGAFEPSVTACL